MSQLPSFHKPAVTEAALAVLLAGEPTEPPVLSGPLLKQASNWISGFQTRHFSIGSGKACYWHSFADAESGKEPRAVFSLLAMELAVDEQSEFRFQVIFASQDRRPYVLSAEIEDSQVQHSRAEWISVLQENCMYAKRKAAYDRASKMVTCVGFDMSHLTELWRLRQQQLGSEGNLGPEIEEAGKEPPSPKVLQFATNVEILEFVQSSFISNTSFAIGDENTSEEIVSEELEKAIAYLAHGPPQEPRRLAGSVLKSAQGRCGLQLRYFEVSDGKMRYWHSLKEAGEQPPRAEYHLCSAKIAISPSHKTQFSISVMENLDREYIFDANVGSSAQDAHSRDEWMEVLKAHEAYARKKIAFAWAGKIAQC